MYTLSYWSYAISLNSLLHNKFFHKLHAIKTVGIKGHITEHLGKKKETFKRVKSQSILFLWLIFPISKYSRIKIMLARLLSVKLQTQYVAKHDANIKLFIGIPYLPTSQNFWMNIDKKLFSHRIFLNKRLILSIIRELNKV